MLDMIFDDALQDYDSHENSKLAGLDDSSSTDATKLKAELNDCKMRLKRFFDTISRDFTVAQ